MKEKETQRVASSEDYCVSENTRRLWAVEMELADVLLDFCQKHDLKVYACYGTLIGAVRHKGFIPWDDDMDFVMMRDDYDRLLQLIKVEGGRLLPENYSFDTDDISVLKLRRNDTTMLQASYRLGKTNQGVWIDVFCLDVAPDNLAEADTGRYDRLRSQIRMDKNYKLRYYAYVPTLHFFVGHLLLKVYFFFKDINRHRKEIEDELRLDAQKYSGQKVWGYVFWSSVYETRKISVYDRSWFDDTVMLPFEDRQLPCPAGWEQLLAVQYGDWRTPVKGGSQHEGACIDLDMPYREFVESRLKAMPWWTRYWYKH